MVSTCISQQDYSLYKLDNCCCCFPQAAIADGVKVIAGWIERLLQQLRLSATRVNLRVEMPSLVKGGPLSLVVLRLDSLEYAGEAAAAGEAAPIRQVRAGC